MEQQGEYIAKKQGVKFMGFPRPSQNFSKLPHAFIDYLPMIDSMAELKVVIYLLRHTWGFSEYGKPKKITTDEFMNGRKKRDGKRMDGGTGLSNNSVITGLEKAIEHGFILVEVDETDKARIEKCYCLNMSDVQDLHSDPQDMHSDCEESAQRSEKETRVRNTRKSVANASLDWKIAHGEPITEEEARQAHLENNAHLEFERAFKFGTLPWDSNTTWTKFHKFVIKLYVTDQNVFKDYVMWRDGDGKYKAFSNRKIRETPAAFMDTGYPEYEASKMYRKTDETRPEYQPVQPEDRSQYVPRPANIPRPNIKAPASFSE
jgi:hypothetical protein